MKLTGPACLLLSFCLIFSAIFVPCAFSASAEGTATAQSLVDELTSENSFTGVLYATRNGEVIAEYANGFANTDEGKEITADTLFPIGSLSKQFCATAVLLLKEQGKLSVDNKITEYFPEYEIGKELTIKNLLTNRSGIRNYQEGIVYGDYELSFEATSAENKQTIKNWIFSKELSFKPDSRYEYSNTNFFLLSLIVEQVSEQSYTDFVKENILIPMEMNNSGFYEEMYDHPELAEHHGELTDPMCKGYAQGAGDLVSNAKDLDKWMTSFKEHSLLSEESYTEMTTDYSPSVGYGYGIGVLPGGGLSHTGAITTYVCTASTYPEDGTNIFAITNDWEEYEENLFNVAYNLEYKLQLTYGDVTNDKNINVKDATLIQKASAKMFNLSENENLCADVNIDGKVNVKDATAIQKYSAKIESDLPLGNFIYK